MTAEQRKLGRQVPGDRVHSVSVDTSQNAESCRCSLPLPSLVPADGGTIDIHAKTATPQDTTALADTPVACSPFNYPQPPMVPTCTQHTPTQARPPTAEATATRTHGGRWRGGGGAAILVFGHAGGRKGSPWSVCG